MGIEPMAFGLALRRSNHWATETPHLNHHIQFRYHCTADNVAVAWLSGCSEIQSSGWLPASDKLTRATLFPPEGEFVQGPNSTGLPWTFRSVPNSTGLPFMEGKWSLVPEQTLLWVEKALHEYLRWAAIPSFGSLQPESQATATLSAVQWWRSWMWWFRCGVSVAQWLERQCANPKAMGSIPIWANSIFLVWFSLPHRCLRFSLSLILTLPRFISTLFVNADDQNKARINYQEAFYLFLEPMQVTTEQS